MLPELSEAYVLLADGAKVVHKAGKHTLRVTHDGKVHVYPIDRFFLCDRIDSNQICCGNPDVAMTKYLATLGKARRLLVELVCKKKGGALFVAGLFAYDAKTAFADKKTRPTAWDARYLLRMKDERGRKPAEWRKMIAARSKLDWTRLAKR